MDKFISSSAPRVQLVNDLAHPYIDGAVERGLLIDENEVRLVDADEQREGVDLAVVGRARIGDLADALREWSTVTLEARYWQVWVPARRESLTLVLDDAADELQAVAWLDVEHNEDLAFEASLRSVLAPLTDRWSARTVLDADPFQGQWLTVRIALDDVTRPVADLVECAAEVEALMGALDGSKLTCPAARDLILGGHAGALVGAREGAWLDAKGAPYRDDAVGAYELAKDVAAFANGQGGLILIPATTRVERGVEVIAEVRELDVGLVDIQAWKDRIAQRLYPVPAGVEVHFVGEHRGQLLIVVPSQTAERQPFLVAGAVEGGRVLAHAVTLPWRDGDMTRFDDVGTVHAALQAYSRALDNRADLDEQVSLATIPAPFRDALLQARRAGLQVDLWPSGFRVHLPGARPIDVSIADLHPKFQAHALENLLDRLSKYLVPPGT